MDSDRDCLEVSWLPEVPVTIIEPELLSAALVGTNKTKYIFKLLKQGTFLHTCIE